MVRVSRILKDFRETGAFNSLIGLWGFVDDTPGRPERWACSIACKASTLKCLDPRAAPCPSLNDAAAAGRVVSDHQYVLKRSAPVVPAARASHPVVDRP